MFENETQLTLERHYIFNRVHSFKILLFIYSFLGLVGAMIGLYYFFDDKLLGIVLWAIVVFGIALIIILSKGTLKKNLNKVMAKSPLSDENNFVRFVFDESKMQTRSTRFGEEVATSVLTYAQLFKVTEYKNFLFIYIGVNRAYVLDGDNMLAGSFADLKEFLKTQLGIKYKKKGK